MPFSSEQSQRNVTAPVLGLGATPRVYRFVRTTRRQRQTTFLEDGPQSAPTLSALIAQSLLRIQLVDKECTPLPTGRFDYIPALRGVFQRVMYNAADSRWFASNPTRNHLLRRENPSEPLEKGSTYVLVWQHEPAQRLHMPVQPRYTRPRFSDAIFRRLERIESPELEKFLTALRWRLSAPHGKIGLYELAAISGLADALRLRASL